MPGWVLVMMPQKGVRNKMGVFWVRDRPRSDYGRAGGGVHKKRAGLRPLPSMLGF